MKKIELIGKAIEELRLAQAEILVPLNRPINEIWFPPTLSLGDGRQLHATKELIAVVFKYATLYLENKPALKKQFKLKEFNQLVEMAFGQALEKIDLDCEIPNLIEITAKEIDIKLSSEIERSHQDLEIVLGCTLFDTFDIYPITIGPVTFRTREQWRDIALKNGDISSISSQRLKKLWSGVRLKKRKYSGDASKEETIADAIGSEPIVCTVLCSALSSEMVKEKSLLVSKLAMCVTSLMWDRPSQGLQRMNLLYDGEFYHQVYVLLGESGYCMTSRSKSRISNGAQSDENLATRITEYKAIFDLLGEVLRGYVQPKGLIKRPNIMSALFQSLWWLHEACREPSDQMAITKYAASMDTLANGKSQNGIIKLIEARIGPKKDERLMTDGRTTQKVVTDVFKKGRSQSIHGTSEIYEHDLSSLRATSEAVARKCIVETSKWLIKNPEIDDVALISKP